MKFRSNLVTTSAFDYINENYADSNCFNGEHHCYTYHQLYDHFYLDWLDILRIGNIGIVLKIDECSNELILTFYNKN